MSDFHRARDIQATFEMSPYIWYPNPIIPDIAKAIGPEPVAYLLAEEQGAIFDKIASEIVP